MTERLNITVDDGIGELLAELAGSRNKMGEKVSELARAASHLERVPAVHDLETMRLMIFGLAAEVKALRAEHEHLRAFVGDPKELYEWHTITAGLGFMLGKERGSNMQQSRLTVSEGNVKVDGYWVNVDFPLKSCTLHRVECSYAMNRAETEYKGMGEMKRDGGWLHFANLFAAEQYCQEHFPTRLFKRCGICHP